MALLKDKAARTEALKLAPTLTSNAEEAFILYSKMGNKIDWSALPLLVELYDIPDSDALIERLETIIQAQREPLDDANT